MKLDDTATVAAVFTRPEGEFVGLYAFQQGDTLARGGKAWHKVSGPALSRINGGELVPVKKTYVHIFDGLDAKGDTPTKDDVSKMGSNL